MRFDLPWQHRVERFACLMQRYPGNASQRRSRSHFTETALIVALGWWQTPGSDEEVEAASPDSDVHQRRTWLILRAGEAIALMTIVAAVIEGTSQVVTFGWSYSGAQAAYTLSSVSIATSACVIAQRILQATRFNGAINSDESAVT